MDDDGIKIGLHSSQTQHSFSYTNDILYRVYSQSIRAVCCTEWTRKIGDTTRNKIQVKRKGKRGRSEGERESEREYVCVSACMYARDGKRSNEQTEGEVESYT